MSGKNIINGKHTLVEEGTELRGTISSSCPIVVMGKVEGEVSGPTIHVSQSGVVAGKVKVAELRSAGEIAGEIEAETVRISGRVRDRTVIRARTLEVTISREAGTEVTFGECELAVGDEPNKQAAVDAALSPSASAAPAAQAPAPAEAAAAAAKPSKRKKGASESWDEATTTSPPIVAETEDDEKKRSSATPPTS